MQLSLKILPIVTGCIVSASITCNSQINLSYDYDASGNRISRTVTVAPSKPMQNKERFCISISILKISINLR